VAGTTTNFAWPFPTNGDVPNVASDIQSLASAIDTSLGAAFTAYTPAWTSTGTAPVIGTGTITGRFKKFGKWGINRITMTAGGTTTFGTLLYRWSLPATWTLFNATSIYGIASIYDTSTTTQYTGAIWAASTTTVSIRTHAATTDASATVPMTPANGDIWQLLMLVELA
jgi:hypothetical protein